MSRIKGSAVTVKKLSLNTAALEAGERAMAKTGRNSLSRYVSELLRRDAVKHGAWLPASPTRQKETAKEQADNDRDKDSAAGGERLAAAGASASGIV